jgi:predicted SAM-dependent methyltransferase
MKGWINVDRARGPEVQVVWDLRKGLPFQDGSCSAIFSEHMIEHITTDDADKLLGECHRVLAAGGVLRLSTPDAGRFLRSYAGDREFLNNSPFAQPVETPMDRINQMMREDSQHLWTYDADSLLLRLRKAGFAQVKEQKFGESLHTRMHNIDSAERAFESLYVEAIR